MVCSHSNGYFEGQKGQICAFVIYLHQYLRKGACYDQSWYNWYKTHIVRHVWSLSWPHNIWPWMCFKGQIIYNRNLYGAYLLNGVCYDQSLHLTHIGWPLNVKSMYLSVKWAVSPESSMLSYEFVWIMSRYDFLGTMEVILSNIWIDFNLTQFQFWSTFHMKWHI